MQRKWWNPESSTQEKHWLRHGSGASGFRCSGKAFQLRHWHVRAHLWSHPKSKRPRHRTDLVVDVCLYMYLCHIGYSTECSSGAQKQDRIFCRNPCLRAQGHHMTSFWFCLRIYSWTLVQSLIADVDLVMWFLSMHRDLAVYFICVYFTQLTCLYDKRTPKHIAVSFLVHLNRLPNALGHCADHIRVRPVINDVRVRIVYLWQLRQVINLRLIGNRLPRVHWQGGKGRQRRRRHGVPCGGRPRSNTDHRHNWRRQTGQRRQRVSTLRHNFFGVLRSSLLFSFYCCYLVVDS